MEIVIRIVCLIVGYLFGLIETGYLYAKAKGFDIRQHGSGNVGTTNMLRTMGKRAGAIVLVGDMLKTFIPVLLAWAICHQFYPELDYIVRLYAAAGVILGHDFPFYLKFKGGKGIACSGALILSFHWGIIPPEVIIFFGIYFLTKYVSLASIFMYLGFLVQVIIFGQAGIFGMSQGMLIEVYIIVFILTIIAISCHRDNIKRLIRGEERRTYLRRSADYELSSVSKETKKSEEKNVLEAEATEIEHAVEEIEDITPKEDSSSEVVKTESEIIQEENGTMKTILPEATESITADEEEEIDLEFEMLENELKAKKKNKTKK